MASDVLQEENTLRIEATVVDQYDNTYEDRFTIDNVLIHFKTKTDHSRPGVGPARG